MRELGADSAAPPTAEQIPQPLRARDGASVTHLLLQHYRSPCSLRQAPRSRADVRRHRPHEPRPCHLRSEAALGWARETHGLVKAPSQVPHVVGRRSTSLQRTGILLRALPHARAPADRLQNRQGGRAARRLAELGGRSSRQREMAQARGSATAGARGNETNLRTSADGTNSSEHAQPAPGAAATTWSQRLRPRG
jgi:hypothetical protein